MTIFITELFKLDLSQLNIKFSEENAFFEDDLIKQYSFPFKIPRERSYMPFFEFLSSHNSIESNKYVKGVLFRNDKYYEAELLLLKISKEIESVLYYSFDKLTIFDKNLRDLPWYSIELQNGIFDFANMVKLQNHPETIINFVPVYDPEKYADYDFGYKTNFINHHESVEGFSEYVPNPLNLPFRFFKMNEMRPFIYIKEILKFIFQQIEYTITGDIISSPIISKALQYHDNSIFYTNNDYSFEDELDLTLSQSNVSGYQPSTVIYNEYVVSKTMTQKGSYKVILELEGALSLSIYGNFYLRCYFNNEILIGGTAGANYNSDGSQNTFNRRLEMEFDVPEDAIGSTLEFRFICHSLVKNTIEGNYEISGTLRPLYRDNIDLKDLLPDVKVGEYVRSIKQTFKMTSVFSPPTQTVEFNFFDSFTDNQQAVDLSRFMIDLVPRSLNKSTGYKIPFSNGETLYLNKSGDFVPPDTGYTETRIPLEPLPIKYIDAQPNLEHQEGLSILFYECNENALPLVDFQDIPLNRIGFVHTFLRNWLYQNLNSEEYNITVQLPIFIASKLTSESKIWFYNNYFLAHNLKRLNVNSLFEKISLRLFKLKSYPIFNLVIDDGSGNGGTDFEPPVAMTTSLSNSSGVFNHISQFYATIYNSPIAGPSSFSIDIYANGSTDPQGFPLSFGWEVLSSPGGNAYGSFLSQNSDHSITNFSSSGYFNLSGDYVIRLTVVNSMGLSDSVDVTVTASSDSNPPPENKIVLAKLDISDIVNTVARFTVNFVDISPSSIDVHLQKVQTGTSLPIGSPIITQISNFSLPHHEIPIPSAGSWQVKAYSGNEFSNTLGWTRII